jgi:hypothetical protein
MSQTSCRNLHHKLLTIKTPERTEIAVSAIGWIWRTET